jgi:GNAT superfamily N-acetyltransferase
LSVTKERLGSYLQRGVSTLRYEGPFALAIRIAKLACRPFGTLSIVTFYRKDLAAPVEAPDARVTVEIRTLQDSDVLRLIPLVVESSQAAQLRWKVSVEQAVRVVRKRLKWGAICFVASHEGEIVHYNWLFPGIEWPMTFVEFAPASPSQVMVDDAFTAEQWRGNGIHRAVHARILQFAQSSGSTTSFARMETDNRSSRKALKQLGYSGYATRIFFQSRRSRKKRVIGWARPPTPFRPA